MLTRPVFQREHLEVTGTRGSSYSSSTHCLKNMLDKYLFSEKLISSFIHSMQGRTVFIYSLKMIY